MNKKNLNEIGRKVDIDVVETEHFNLILGKILSSDSRAVELRKLVSGKAILVKDVAEKIFSDEKDELL